MRILVVQESDYDSRGPHQQHHILERMKEKGNEVLVIDYEIDWRMSKSNIITRRRSFLSCGKIKPTVSIPVIRPATLNVPLLSYIVLLILHLIELIRTASFQVGDYYNLVSISEQDAAIDSY